MKNLSLAIVPSIFFLLSSLQVAYADVPPGDLSQMVKILVCEPKEVSDTQYNVDLVREGQQLKLLIHVSLFDAESTEYFDVVSVNRRSVSYTTLRSESSGVTLTVSKKGKLNLAGEATFSGVFRGGAEYGVYAVNCVKQVPPEVPPEVAPPVGVPAAPGNEGSADGAAPAPSVQSEAKPVVPAATIPAPTHKPVVFPPRRPVGH